MEWRGRRRSSNVEDRRSQRAGGGMGGFPGGIPLGGGLGVGGILILVVLMFLFGNPLDMLSGPGVQSGVNLPYSETAQEADLAEFASVVLADTEDVWSEIFRDLGETYVPPKLVLYRGTVNSGCGFASSQSGPFYCPADQKIYIDLNFYEELHQRFKAPGDFAFAYVIAHEVGHHVQTLLGVTEQVMPLRERLSETEFNKYLVSFELQADYLAGVFAHHEQGRGYLEAGDIEEALNAANAIGDDKIQEEALGYVVPDRFTHGTSQQRKDWFTKGFKAGDLSQWDTFKALN